MTIPPRERLQGWPWPGDEALATQELPPRFAGGKCVAIVELAEEVDDLLDLLADSEQLEATARQNPGQALDALEGPLDGALEKSQHALRDGFMHWHRHVATDVDRRAEGDHRRDALAAPIRRRLIDEEPALGVAGHVHVVAGGLPDDVHALVAGEDVIVERPLHPA